MPDMAGTVETVELHRVHWWRFGYKLNLSILIGIDNGIQRIALAYKFVAILCHGTVPPTGGGDRVKTRTHVRNPPSWITQTFFHVEL